MSAKEVRPAGGGRVPAQVVPVVYDLTVWVAPKIAAFPRIHRHTLGERLLSAHLHVLEALLGAQYSPRHQKGPSLSAANSRLEMLRLLYRLAGDLRCLSRPEYEHSARRLVDAGRMVGGWLRSVQSAADSGDGSSSRAPAV